MNRKDLRASAAMIALVGTIDLIAVGYANYVPTKFLLNHGVSRAKIERTLLFDLYDQMSPMEKSMTIAGTAGRYVAYLTN